MSDAVDSQFIEKKRQNQEATIAFLQTCRRQFNSKRMAWSQTSKLRLPFLIETLDSLTDLFIERHHLESVITEAEGKDVAPYEFPEPPLPSVNKLLGRYGSDDRPALSSWFEAEGEISEWLWSLQQMPDDYDYQYWKGSEVLAKLQTAIFLERWFGDDK